MTDVFGVGPIVAAYLIGYSGDIRRFPSAGHYARYNATAPIEASSGPKVRHRLNPNGNRQLNHAIHIAALGQISHDTPGRAYYLAKQADGKSRKEAMRCLKRRISDAVYRQLRADARPLNETGSGRTIRGDSESSAAGRSLNTGTSERSLPNPNNNATNRSTRRATGTTQRVQTGDRTRHLTQTGFALERLWPAQIGRSGAGQGVGLPMSCTGIAGASRRALSVAVSSWARGV